MPPFYFIRENKWEGNDMKSFVLIHILRAIRIMISFITKDCVPKKVNHFHSSFQIKNNSFFKKIKVTKLSP